MPGLFFKNKALAQEFPLDFVKFLRRLFLTEQLRWLLLNMLNLKAYFECIFIKLMMPELLWLLDKML